MCYNVTGSIEGIDNSADTPNFRSLEVWGLKAGTRDESSSSEKIPVSEFRITIGFDRRPFIFNIKAMHLWLEERISLVTLQSSIRSVNDMEHKLISITSRRI